MKSKFSKIRVISFTKKTNVLNFQYNLRNSLILLTYCIKNCDVHIYCKLHFHYYVHFRFSHGMKSLRSIRTITFSFSTIESLLLPGTLLRLLIRINLSAYNENLQPFAYQASTLNALSLVNALNVAPLSSKQPASVFLLGTYVTLPCSVAPPATILQLDVLPLQMQFVYLQIFL
jgi:hypothetical protein